MNEFHNIISFRELVKGDKLKTTQLREVGIEQPITSYLLESPKQGKGLKKTVLVDAKGSEVGLFDEAGSIYACDVMAVERDGEWLSVVGQPETFNPFD
jgi:hypothetical protein|tara:strand:+ start:7765 stop:8058 length:294 start_codon:yes stop_codon:yes gene_type:complete